VTPTMSTVLY